MGCGRLGLWVALTRHPLDVLVVRELVTFVSWFSYKPTFCQPGHVLSLSPGATLILCVCVKQSPFLPIPGLSIAVLALTHSLSQTHTPTHSQMFAYTPVSLSPYFASSGETWGTGSGSSVEPLAREGICPSSSGLWGQACFLQDKGEQTPFQGSPHLCLPWGPMGREAECWMGSPLTPAS